MYAVISDIHANLEALEAVLADIDGQGIDDIICLGDLVGYGPDPIACVDLVLGRGIPTIMGNHEEALVNGGYGFHARALSAINWTRDALKPGFFSGPAVRRRWEWVTNLPLTLERGLDQFVHGSPRDPTTEYLLVQEVAWAHEKYSEVFESVERLLFVGHTHTPCVITCSLDAWLPPDVDDVFDIPQDGSKAIINVGSVGQPRDGDRRACYVVVDDLQVRWRRVPYRVDRTVEKIEGVDRLDVMLGERLKVGK